ncbi:AraC-type DNA-binding protein [Eubacterium ruminantium]|nr:AraC-type DNA-binding protein [Eubacterium ruminantium]
MRVSDKTIDRIYINSAGRSADYLMAVNHYHNYYELYYVRHGRVRFYVNNSLFTLQSGDFMVIPPKVIHYVNYLSQCTRINIYFTEEDLYDNSVPFMPDLSSRFLRTIIMHVPRIYRDQIHIVIDAMVAEENTDDSSTPTMQKLLLRELLLYCNRFCIFRTESDAESKADKILDSVKYINENYNQPINLELLAGFAGFSPSYFSKKFRITTGTGMKEYLTYVRLTHALNELITTNHSITEIAMNSGFGDSNYFKDSFKKMYNMSPREYRKSMLDKYILYEVNKES